jgi:hypothetical protein
MQNVQAREMRPFWSQMVHGFWAFGGSLAQLGAIWGGRTSSRRAQTGESQPLERVWFF